MHNAPGGQGPRPTRTFRTRLAGFARTPAGVGVLVVVALAGVIAVGGAIGGASGSAGAVAAASPSAQTGSPASNPAAAPSSSPSTPPSARPTSTPSAAPSAAPTPSAIPTPSATPAPSPSAPPPIASTDGVPAKALQVRLDKIRKKLGIPGVSVAILWDDGRRWLGASGMRDVVAADPMTTGTAFALASVSKTATAAVVLQLVEEGLLSLDQKVAPLLPAFDMNPKITVRQLLDHTSGLPDFFLNAKIERQLRKDKSAAWTAEKTWAYVPDKRPKPGKFWIYSNSNYLALGQLVEAVTGRVRSPSRSANGCWTRWASRARGSRRRKSPGPRARSRTGWSRRPAAASAPSRWPARATSCRSGRWSRRPAVRVRWPPRPWTRPAGCGPSRAATS